MTREQFLKGITYLTIAYNKEFDKHQVEVWYDFFKEDNYDSFRQSVKRIITKSKYMPSIAELKEEIALNENPTLQLNADEEFDKVRKAISRYGMYRPEELLQSLNPYTAKITSQIGLQRICLSEDIQWIKKEFIGEFNAQKNRYEEILKTNADQLTMSEIAKKLELGNLVNDKKLIGGKND